MMAEKGRMAGDLRECRPLKQWLQAISGDGATLILKYPARSPALERAGWEGIAFLGLMEEIMIFGAKMELFTLFWGACRWM
ncbi:hypothetical protein DCC81_00800 [Chitinophaga parva]|uniref:Uncharacterized protein n=1 Tax=Chitinophaga parva TaxID=2169414 RepID=A0A2T7BK54_9BACT|nr:hypothetical protein DCC81_00800 [Chitinophaga parva]